MTSQRLKGTAFAFLLAAGTLFGGSVLAADVQPQEQEQAEEEARQAEERKEQRRRSNIFWLLFSGNILVKKGASEY